MRGVRHEGNTARETMARIGTLSMGGRGAAPGAPVVHAVAFDLSHDPKCDFLYSLDGLSWEVEIKAGQRSVIARTPDVLERSELLATGLEYAQRGLDIVSFERRSEAVLANPGDTHILPFSRDNRLVLQHVDVSDLGVSIGAEAVVRDADGNIREQEVPPPVWTPGLRFYRLSQTSRDLYDAYRNLFLGLEALLDTACPKRADERERDWLLRAFSGIAQDAGLRELVPKNVTDPVD